MTILDLYTNTNQYFETKNHTKINQRSNNSEKFKNPSRNEK